MAVYRVKKSALTTRGAAQKFWDVQNRAMVRDHGWIWKDLDQDELTNTGEYADLAKVHPGLHVRWYQSISTQEIEAWDVSELEPFDGGDT